MINKISNYYDNNISNMEVSNLLDREINILDEYFLVKNSNKDNSKYTLLKEKETLKCDYRIEKPAEIFERTKQDHWIDYIWLYIKVNNIPLYIGAYRDGIIREDDMKKYFSNLIENKSSPLTLQELYDKLSELNTNNTDLCELKETLDIHKNDLILKEVIITAITSNILYSKQDDFLSNLKRAKLFIKNIDDYSIDEMQKEKECQFTLK